MKRRTNKPPKDGVFAALHEDRASWPGIAVIVALGFLATVGEGAALVLIVPLAESVATDSGIGGRIGDLIGTPSPTSIIVLGVVLTVTSVGLRIASAILQAKLVRGVENGHRKRAYRAFIEAQPRSQQAERAGRLVELVNRSSYKGLRLGHAVGVLKSLASIAVFATGAVLVQPQGAVVIAGIGLLMFGLFRPIITKTRTASHDAAAAQYPIAEHLAETQSARLELRTFGAETWARSRFDGLTDDLTTARLRQAVLGSIMSPLYQGTAMIGIFGVLLAARSSSSLDLPSLGAVALLLLRSLSYGQSFQGSFQRLHDASAVTAAFEESVQALERDRALWGSERLEPVETVEFCDLGFSYGEQTPALVDVSVRISKGERVGIVGPSGAGKSTLVNLLLRILRAESGAVLVNGVPVDEYTAESWAAQVAVVPQQPTLLHGTIGENISLFRDSITPQRMQSAARDAALAPAIELLPEGYDTLVGPSSRALSGGQIQRVGLARMLAGSPSILLLDEPTSALDLESESLIRDTLDRLPRDVVVIVVAHRMSTLRFCDRIIVLEDGRVVSDGTPSEVALDNRYFELSR